MNRSVIEAAKPRSPRRDLRVDEGREAPPETEMGVARLSGGCGQVANQLVDRGGQVVFGVHWSAVLSHLEMQMRAGGPARVPHAADGLPLRTVSPSWAMTTERCAYTVRIPRPCWSTTACPRGPAVSRA